MELLELMRNRRSIRKYQKRPVEHEKPACIRQRWLFAFLHPNFDKLLPFNESKKDSILTICKLYGKVPDSLSTALSGLNDLDLLEKVFKFTLTNKSLEEIEQYICSL